MHFYVVMRLFSSTMGCFHSIQHRSVRSLALEQDLLHRASVLLCIVFFIDTLRQARLQKDTRGSCLLFRLWGVLFWLHGWEHDHFLQSPSKRGTEEG